MRNPFRNPFKQRGLPDSLHQDGNLQQNMHQNDGSNIIPISHNFVPPQLHDLHPIGPTSASAPIGYPNSNLYGENDHPYTTHTETAYPYSFQPAGVDLDFNTGKNVNVNLGGEQTNEGIEAYNGAASATPQSGRIVMKTGNNTNEGKKQVNGGIKFGNA